MSTLAKTLRGITKYATVAAAFRNTGWRSSLRRHPICSMLRAFLPDLPVLCPTKADKALWKTLPSSEPGLFSSSTTWDALVPAGPSVSWFFTVWFSVAFLNTLSYFGLFSAIFFLHKIISVHGD